MTLQSSLNNKPSQSRRYVYPEFVINETTGHITINMIDNINGQVVRQIPSAELSKLLQRLFLG